jgi:hypothetical protein
MSWSASGNTLEIFIEEVEAQELGKLWVVIVESIETNHRPLAISFANENSANSFRQSLALSLKIAVSFEVHG